MPYTNITLLSQLVTGQVDPADSEVASELAPALRQLKEFLCTYLAVSHDDTGALKQDALNNASQVSLLTVTGAKIAHNTIELVNMASDSVDSPQLVADAVVTDKIADLAVTNAKIANGTIAGTKLATGAVDTTQIADGAVTNVKVADSSVTADKLAGDGSTNTFASRISAGSLAASAMVAAPSDEPCLLAVMESAASNAIAKIGGMLSATLNTATTPPTLEFSIGAGTAGETATLIRQSSSGQLTASTWNLRQGLSRVIGDDDIIKISGTNTIQIVNDGTYLVLAVAMGYSCGLHQVVLEDDSTPAQRFATGTTSYAGTGQQSMSMLFGVLDVDGYDSSTPLNLQLKHWATVTDAAGQGRTGLTDDWTAAVLLLGV